MRPDLKIAHFLGSLTQGLEGYELTAAQQEQSEYRRVSTSNALKAAQRLLKQGDWQQDGETFTCRIGAGNYDALLPSGRQPSAGIAADVAKALELIVRAELFERDLPCDNHVTATDPNTRPVSDYSPNAKCPDVIFAVTAEPRIFQALCTPELRRPDFH